MNSDSLNMVSRLGEGHMPWTFFLSEPQLKTTVARMHAMDADYAFELFSIKTCAPQFKWHNKSFLGSVC